MATEDPNRTKGEMVLIVEANQKKMKHFSSQAVKNITIWLAKNYL